MTQDQSQVAATRIVGGVGTGKTQELINRAVEALKQDAKAAYVLVLCATPQAALAFKARLDAAAEAAGVSAADVAVTTPRALALDVMGDAEAIRWSGREPRLLTD